MARRIPRGASTGPRTLLAAAVALAALTAAGPLATGVAAAAGSPPGEQLVAPLSAPAPDPLAVYAATPAGVLLRDTGTFAYTWRSADGSLVRPLGALTLPHVISGGLGGSLIESSTASGAGGASVRVYDPVADTATTVPLGSSYDAVNVLPGQGGWQVVALRETKDAQGLVTRTEIHLIDPAAAGGPADRLVATVARVTRWHLTPTGLALLFTEDGDSAQYLGWIDAAAGTLTGLHAVPASTLRLLSNSTSYGYYLSGSATLYSVDDPQAAPRTVQGPAQAADATAPQLDDTALYVTAASASARDKTPSPLYRQPLDGSAATVALADAGQPLRANDGSVVVDADGTHGVDAYRLDGVSGGPVAVHHYDDRWPARAGLSLVRGALAFTETGAGGDAVHSVAAYGSPAATVASVSADALAHCADGSPCPVLAEGGGTYGAAYLTHAADGADVLNAGTGTAVALGTAGGRIVSAGADDVLYAAADGTQSVVDMARRTVVRTRAAGAAALWGDTLWSATGTAGVLAAEDAATGAGHTTLSTDAPCVPAEIQAVLTRIYWSCGASGPAGVYDRAAGRSVAVPAGPALLGDGYVLRHADGGLLLTDVHTGQAAAARRIADLAGPAAGVDDRGVSWTVDRFGERVAYTDAASTTHLLPAGVPASALGMLASSGTSVDPRAGAAWHGQWLLTRAAAAWSVQVTGPDGARLGNLGDAQGASSPGVITLSWNGRDEFGRPGPDGRYTWTLTAKPADGQGPGLTATGAFTLTGGEPVWRDYDGDGRPDLLGTPASSATTLRTHPGAPGGTFDGVVTTTGWPSGALIVPAGDVDGDGASDLLARTPSGEVRLYRGTATAPPNPAAGYRVVATGWQGYDTVLQAGYGEAGSPPVFVARDTSGKLWLLGTDGKGGFTAGRRYLSAGWDTYDTLTAVRGFAGPGSVSLVGRDASGHLWRHGFAASQVLPGRTELSGGWNAYTALVAVGDLDGDGRPEIVGRDATGTLWRHSADGAGAIAAGRVRLSAGWNYYATLI
ncbi:FG-GAP-like repeat-containing protein [Streptomyces sp. V4-01]|uniref:FG-GAP-like repeat-containing protein n=1 Tax=Actinacidiphila polyblastidii TaxID=3110430 RepID=A0ABU7PI49_9ACTN|nr:FG-GAP-like repeat-containing protein [Streptomyces sp. V4-01]